jgi:hypothetical protein
MVVGEKRERRAKREWYTSTPALSGVWMINNSPLQKSGLLGRQKAGSCEGETRVCIFYTAIDKMACRWQDSGGFSIINWLCSYASSFFYFWLIPVVEKREIARVVLFVFSFSASPSMCVPGYRAFDRDDGGLTCRSLCRLC